MAPDSPDQDRQPTAIELFLAVALTVVSIAIALVLWRANVVGSSAGDARSAGIIDTLKVEALRTNNLMSLYVEADLAAGVAARQAANDALAKSPNAADIEAASTEALYILPTLSKLNPLASHPGYVRADGSLDLDRRLRELNRENEVDADPDGAFAEESELASRQRWLNAAAVVLAFALFWLTVAEVLKDRSRLAALLAASSVFVAGLVLVSLIETGVVA